MGAAVFFFVMMHGSGHAATVSPEVDLAMAGFAALAAGIGAYVSTRQQARAAR